jgi:hypothetical protein
VRAAVLAGFRQRECWKRMRQTAAGNMKPSKKKSTERIDGIVASIIGLGRALLTVKQCSVYETGGVCSRWNRTLLELRRWCQYEFCFGGG